jgi:hypothetical protein
VLGPETAELAWGPSAAGSGLSPYVGVRLTDEGYNVLDLYEQARKLREPTLSPHGYFRSLKNGKHT